MAVGDIYRLTVNNTLNNQYCLNVFHYAVTTQAGVTSSQECATKFIGNNGVNWKAAVSSDVAFAFVWCQRIWPLPALLPTQDVTWTGNGTGASPAVPPADAAVIKKLTALAGRKYRGRSYIAGIPASGVSAGAITAGQLTKLADLRDGLILPLAPVGGNVYSPCIYHGSGSYDVVTTGALDAVLRTQRRRQLGKGI